MPGYNKEEDTGSLLHNTKSYLMFVQNFKILHAVVLEKSLTQTSLHIKLEWEIEEEKTKAK